MISNRLIPLLLGGAFQLSANAGDVLPPYLTGSWGSAHALFEGTDKQSAIYLPADGVGMIAGSTSALRRADGSDDGKHAPRALMGFPIRAQLDGNTLTAHVFLPGNDAQARKAAGMTFICRYQPSAPALTCTGPDGVPILMTYHSDVIPEDVLGTLAQVRAAQ
jgi:hypothetical protein